MASNASCAIQRLISFGFEGRWVVWYSEKGQSRMAMLLARPSKWQSVNVACMAKHGVIRQNGNGNCLFYSQSLSGHLLICSMVIVREEYGSDFYYYERDEKKTAAQSIFQIETYIFCVWAWEAILVYLIILVADIV